MSRPGAPDLLITSLQNERVKAIRALDMRKERRETGLFVAEGASVLISAMEAGIAPQTIVIEGAAPRDGPVGDLLAWARGMGTEIMPVSRAVLEKLAHKDNPQSLIGVFRQMWGQAPRPQGLAAASVWLALEEIRDPGNLGTIIRTAHAVGAAGIVLVGAGCDPFSRESVRATMGSIFAVPLARLERAPFLALIAAWPGDSVATSLAASEDFRARPYRRPTLLVMGGEGPGLSEDATKACVRRVRIPMASGIDSLNLAIATALTLYQIGGPPLSPSDAGQQGAPPRPEPRRRR